MSDFEFNWQKPAVDFAQGIKTTDSIIGERRQSYDARNSELAQLNAELEQVEAQIEQFDRMNPGIASGDIDVAATMMEAGNIAPYQQAVNAEIGRRQMGESAKAGAMSGVWNGIDNARNALAGFAKMSDDQKETARDIARVELGKARRAANGAELPAEYYDVERMLENPDTGDGMNNESYWRNKFTAKVRNKTLRDADIADLKKFADENPNKELTSKLNAIIREFEGKTVEKNDEYEKARAEAERDAGLINSIKNKDMRRNEYFNGSKNLKTFYDFDEKTSMVVKKKGA